MSYLSTRERIDLNQRPDDWLGGGPRGSSYAIKRASSVRSFQPKRTTNSPASPTGKQSKYTMRPSLESRGYSSSSLNTAPRQVAPYHQRQPASPTKSNKERPGLGEREDSSSSLCSHGSVSKSVADRQASLMRQFSSPSLTMEPSYKQRPAQEQAQKYRKSRENRNKKQPSQPQQDDATEDPTETSGESSSGLLREVGNNSMEDKKHSEGQDYWFYNKSSKTRGKNWKNDDDNKSHNSSQTGSDTARVASSPPPRSAHVSSREEASLEAFRNAEETRMSQQQRKKAEAKKERQNRRTAHENSRSVQALVSPARRRESMEAAFPVGVTFEDDVPNAKEEDHFVPSSSKKFSETTQPEAKSQFDLARSWMSSGASSSGTSNSSSAKAFVEAVANQHRHQKPKHHSGSGKKKHQPSKQHRGKEGEGSVSPKPSMHKKKIKSPKSKRVKPKVKPQQDDGSVTSHTSTLSMVQRKKEHAALLERAQSLSMLCGPAVKSPPPKAASSSSSEKENNNKKTDSDGRDASGLKKSLSSSDLLTKYDMQSRKQEKAKRLERAKERIRRQEEEEQKEFQSEERRRERAYFWYVRLGTPNRDDMKEMVGRQINDCTPEDVDLLPWHSGGYVVNISAMLERSNPH